MADDLFGGEGWFDGDAALQSRLREDAAADMLAQHVAPHDPAPPQAEPQGLAGPLPDEERPLDLTAGISPEDIRRAKQTLERGLAERLDRGFAAMREQMRANLPAGRKANPSDAQPIIVRLTDARDFAQAMAAAWTAVGKRAENLVGNLLDEAGVVEYGRTGAVTNRATVSDGRGSEIVAAYKPKITHPVNSERVIGCVRRLASRIAAESVVDCIDPDPAAPHGAGTAFHRGAMWALESVQRLANLNQTWRRTEIDVFARQIEEAGHPEIAADLRRAVQTVEDEGKTTIERREPSKGRRRGAEQTG